MTRPDRRENARWAYLLASLLLLITSLAILVTSQAIRAPVNTDRVARQQAAMAVAESFYGAVNLFIETGDRSSLDRVVASELVLHPEPINADVDLGGLVAQLAAIRMSDPEFRFLVESMSVTEDGDLVTTRLRANAAEMTPFLGRPLPAMVSTHNWAPIELLRLSRGRVIERWSGNTEAGTFQPLARSTLPPADATSPRVIQIWRLMLNAHSIAPTVNGLSTRLLIVEQGSVAITSFEQRFETAPSNSSLPAPQITQTIPPSAVALATGSSRMTIPGENYVLANSSDLPAVVLVAARLGVGDSGTSPLFPTTAGVRATKLASQLMRTSSNDVIACGRVALREGEIVDWAAAAGSLIAMTEAGVVDFQLGGVDVSDNSVFVEQLGMRWTAREDSILLVVTLFPEIRLTVPISTPAEY